MELLEYIAKQMQYYLSDFHYVEKLILAEPIFYDVLELFPTNVWLSAYQYIFNEEKTPDYPTSEAVFHAIYTRLLSQGTPLDPMSTRTSTQFRKYLRTAGKPVKV